MRTDRMSKQAEHVTALVTQTPSAECDEGDEWLEAVKTLIGLGAFTTDDGSVTVRSVPGKFKVEAYVAGCRVCRCPGDCPQAGAQWLLPGSAALRTFLTEHQHRGSAADRLCTGEPAYGDEA